MVKRIVKESYEDDANRLLNKLDEYIDMLIDKRASLTESESVFSAMQYDLGVFDRCETIRDELSKVLDNISAIEYEVEHNDYE